MLPHSAQWTRTIAGSHTPTLRVDSWLGGRLLASDLPVSGGSITFNAGQNPRGSLKVSFADPDGRLSMGPGGPLAADGQELVVRLGVEGGRYRESFQRGVFQIQKSESDLEIVEYPRPAIPDSPIYVKRGQVIDTEAVDRAQIVSDAKFLSAVQPSAGSVLAEIPLLLRPIGIGWLAPAIADAAIPGDLTYDSDRLKAIQDLADVVNADLIFNEMGVATLQSRTLGASVFKIAAGAGGTRLSLKKIASRVGVYNAAVSRSSGSGDAVQLQSIATVTAGRQAFTGPFGQKPYFHASPLLTAQAATDADARTTLARVRGQLRQVIPVSCVSNPALEVHDVVTLTVGSGSVDGEVLSMTLPLLGGVMTLDVAVDPDVLEEVDGKSLRSGRRG